MWDDTRLGFSHMTTFSRLAPATDEQWLRSGIKSLAMHKPTDIMVFDLAPLDDAKAWIAE
jgi:hypothetical protein